MRSRDPAHENQLNSISGCGVQELRSRIAIRDHNELGYLASEVLATLIRSKYGEADGVVTDAVVALNRRIQVLAGKRVRAFDAWGPLLDRGSEVMSDVIDYVWEKLLADRSSVSNAEVRFAVFVRDRVDDFMRHMLTEKNSMESVDSMTVTDEDGEITPFIDTVADSDAETPEEACARMGQSKEVMRILVGLPRAEYNAFYYRRELEYEWSKVAELLDCSIPTARKYLQQAEERLKGGIT